MYGSRSVRSQDPPFALLERVAKGEQITITMHGVPVALLVAPGGGRSPHKETVAAMRALRKHVKPAKVTVREMIAEGRRH